MADADEAFAGRVGELALLEEELRTVQDGSPRAVLVEGPAGTGKSALVQRFLAGAGKARVAVASGDEIESALPYATVEQLASGLGAARLPHGPLARPADAPPAVGTRLVEVLAGAGDEPLVVVVEDAQWADSASLQALAYALRRLDGGRILVVLVLTPAEPDRLPQALRRLVAEQGRIVHLGGLGAAELGELAARLGFGHLSRSALERLVQHTEGNPSHLRALLQELDPDLLVRPGEQLPAPRAFASAVQARLEACTPETQSFVEAVSVLGQCASVDLARRLAGIGEPTAVVEESTTCELLDLVATTHTREVAFQSPLIRAAVYHHLTPARRSQLHRDAAQLLDGAVALEHRAASTLVGDSALAGELARCADSEADHGMTSAAAGHLVTAARVSADPQERERFLLSAAECLLLGGDRAEAQALLGHLASVSGGARRRCALGYLALLAGNHGQSELLLTGAWELANPAEEPDVRAVSSEQLAVLRSLQVRPSEAAEWAKRAMDAGPRPGATSVALAIRVISLALSGRPDDALDLVASLPEGPTELTASVTAGLVGRGMVRLWLGDLANARADLCAVVESGVGSPASWACVAGRAGVAYADYRLGDWAASSVGAGVARAAARESGHAFLLPLVHAVASLVPAARGDWGQAEIHVRSAREGAARGHDAVNVSLAAAAEANLRFSQHDHAEVVAALEPLQQLESVDAVQRANAFSWREHLVEALVALDRVGEAEGALLSLEEDIRAVPHQRPLSLAGAARLRGILEGARGHTTGAQEAFEAAKAHLEGAAVPFEQAQVDDAYGRFLRRAGERRAASSNLRAAAEVYAQLDARPFLQRVDRELAACGLSPRSRPYAHPPELTPQEVAVAQLVVTGHTNKEVATELVVSPKTVEFHLANIFTKLGVRSRRQLSAALAAAGFPDVTEPRKVSRTPRVKD